MNEKGISCRAYTSPTIISNALFDNIIGIIFSSAPAEINYNSFWQNNSLYSGDFPPPLFGEIVIVNLNGDPCDPYLNLFMDPLFVDPVNLDFHLTENSPCIDAGDPDPEYYDPDGTIADIGAFYYNQLGQDYFPFPDSSAIWNEYSIHVEHPQSVASKTRYGTIGDTTIGDIEYLKIYRLIDDTCLNISNAQYLGAIREENKKIYTITTFHGEEEILLYDFSKNVGDTIYSNSPEGYMASPVVISSIDTVELNDGSNRRRYWINGSLDEFWIEGIGSQGGLFIPITDLILNYYEPHLSCFKQNESTVYLNNYSCDKCFCTLGTSINEIGEIQVQVYPNPFSDQITIESKNEYSEIRIYNSCGNIIRTFDRINYPIKIDLGELPVGLYFIQMIGEGFNYTGKILKKN